MLNGVVYVAFGSHGDAHLEKYHGWVFAYDATTLKQVGVFATTPDAPIGTTTSAAGIWQSGMGLAADPQGFIYFTTGNGDFTAAAGKQNYGDTVIKLTAAQHSPSLSVADYFTPSYQGTLLSADYDLGSGGVLILPDPPLGTNLPAVLVAAGKDGNILLIDRNNMGQFTPNPPDRLGFPGKVVQVPPVNMNPSVRPSDPPGMWGVWGGPAYYKSSQEQQFIYYCGNGERWHNGPDGHLQAYLFSGDSLKLTNQSQQTLPGIRPNETGGATPNVSSNQQEAGTAVVWAIARSNPLKLFAFDATNVTKQLLGAGAGLDCGPWNNTVSGPFIEPTTIQGKVYVPGDGQLTIFGL